MTNPVDTRYIQNRDSMIETILDYWQEGWYEGDQSDVVDELRGMHNGSEKPLDKWSDSDIVNEYERAVEFLDWNSVYEVPELED